MPLEAVIVVLDNSEYALNGDYGTTRWDSQLDSVKVLYNAKMNSNPENVLGVMTMAGKSPEVLASPTQNFGAIISAISDVKLQGEADLMTGINVAQLALKHRQNKNQRQRVIVFVGSPLETTSSQELVKLGKKMKKNNVAVDIINFGEDTENEEKLREFVEAVNSSDNSHLVSVPAGTVLLSDMILSSSMLAEDGVVPPGGGGGGSGSGTGAGGEGGENGGGDFGAVDPNLDPELAMALRMSLEEERARQSRTQETQPAAAAASSSTLPTVQEGVLAGESLATATAGPSAETVATSLPPDLASNAAAGPPQVPASSVNEQSTPAVGPTSILSEAPAVKLEETEDSSMEADEDADLAMALALSKGEGDVDMNAAAGDNNEDEEMDEDEAIARAIAMSMKEEEQS